MTDQLTPTPSDAPDKLLGNPEVNFFGVTNYRNQNRKFGIKLDDRRRHVYVIGKTGMGKTTLMENMILNDIYAGHGVGYVDPHGDTAEKLLDYIPPHRINDVVYFNPADIDYPIGFNILETIRPEQKHLVVSGLMAVFKKIWPDVWSARMEYILNNTILALIDFPNSTLLGINRLLADDEFRNRVVANTKDPVVKAFWMNEFAGYNDRYKQEAVAPIQNKIGQFLSASIIRNIVAQVKSSIDIRDIMDNRKILIMNLSKGRIGEDNSRLLGGMLINRLQLAAMERVDIPEAERKDFFLYVDEFQNFATESFAGILSEARKYRLGLIMAHQYMEQLSEEVLAAVIGNIGTIISFRVGSTDSEILEKEFAPVFMGTDIVNLAKFQIFLKLMIDGIASQPFSAMTLPPIAQCTHSMDKVIKVSRERYAVPRDRIEDKIARWSGMTIGEDAGVPDDEFDVDTTAEKKVERPPIARPTPTPAPTRPTNTMSAPMEKRPTNFAPKSTPRDNRSGGFGGSVGRGDNRSSGKNNFNGPPSNVRPPVQRPQNNKPTNFSG
ncbi:MAG: hypothetical protein A2261_03525, partial [Candidatus Magasanikbacteria bacterium RIFOXYA2_FULL_44_8]